MTATGGWYAVNTYIGREKRVKELIEKMGFDGIRVCNFSKALAERKRNVLKVRVSTVFPGYIFLSGNLDLQSYISICGLTEVIGFVTDGTEPLTVTDKTVISLLEEAVRYSNNAIKESVITISEPGLRIHAGPLKGMESIVKRTALRNKRVYVNLSLFGKEHMVSMPAVMTAG